MLFNSFDFAVFLPIVFLFYWFVTSCNLGLQNTLLLVVSYIFYGWWDWRFLFLIFFSTLVDYFVGLKIPKAENPYMKTGLLVLSLLVNLGLLAFFKYYNFFLDSFAEAFTFFGSDLNVRHLDIILPVGISFYTFQTLSYTIDIYKGRLFPTKSFLAFGAFVSFFPQLVAGPIERASNLLPQFLNKRKFNQAAAEDGCRQMLWGLFKKVVIADTLAIFVDDIFLNYGSYHSGYLLLGAFFFAFQIYCDFSAYSDIAIGTAKLFGFELMKNFNYPYFSRNIVEFWRRWHISLSTWFRDYVFIPLGGSRVGRSRYFRNILAVFLVSGLWHGANWTFIIWGLIHALLYLPNIYSRQKDYRKNEDFVLRDIIPMVITFCFVCLAWIFFRAENLTIAFDYLTRALDLSQLRIPVKFRSGILYILVLVVLEWFNRNKDHVLAGLKQPPLVRWTIYYLLLFGIFAFWKPEVQSFIYFQF